MKFFLRVVKNFIILWAVLILANQYVFSGPFTRMVPTTEDGKEKRVVADPCVFKIGYLCPPEQKWKYQPTKSWGGWSHKEYNHE